MIEIIPAILPEDIDDLRAKVSLVKNSVKTVQIDLCDGKFVPSKTWPYNNKDRSFYNKILAEEEGLPFWQDMEYEFDLMVKNSTKDFQNIMKLGPSRLIFHFEAEEELEEFFKNLDPFYANHIPIAVAINTNTDPNALLPFRDFISYVQCMGIEKIGYQGEPFDPKVLEQIAGVRKIFPGMPISVDGAVSLKTAHDLIEAGATRLVIGSALFNEPDIRRALEDFKRIVML
jgi:ribulose-phosphate 3-epimerase